MPATGYIQTHTHTYLVKRVPAVPNVVTDMMLAETNTPPMSSWLLKFCLYGLC